MAQMSMMCGKCGVDVSAAKRFKDSKGRFFCAPCASALRAQAQRPVQHQHSSDSTDMMPSILGGPPAHSAAPPQPADDGIIALADEPASVAPKRDPRTIDTCPDCGVPMAPSQNICKACGFNRATGHHIGKASADERDAASGVKPTHRERPCKKCGYDLTGLKTGRCPECGTVNARMARARDTEAQTLRSMYITPLIMAAIGIVIAMGVHYARGELASGNGGVWHLVQFLIMFAITVPIGFATYVGCSIAFIGFDEPRGVTFVRLLGVNAVTAAVAAVLRGMLLGTGFGWGSWFVEWFIFVGLLMQVMELDFDDAWLVAAVTYLVQIVIGFAVIFTLLKYF